MTDATPHKAKEGKCPLTTVLNLATDTAKAELGTDASNKRVCTTAKVVTAVTENNKTKTTSVDAGVTLGVSSSEVDVPASDCDDCCK